MAAHPPVLVHATSVAIAGRGVLIQGPSGAGKSDLALRLIDRGATLVSDDYTLAVPREGTLLLRAPDNIAGRMEIRHLGIVDMPHATDVPAALAIRLEDDPARMPEQIPELVIGGVALPLAALAGREASAPLKVEWALRTLAGRTGAG